MIDTIRRQTTSTESSRKVSLLCFFSRPAKPSSPVQNASMVKPGASSSTKNASFAQLSGCGGSDGYVARAAKNEEATGYISNVKEKFLLGEFYCGISIVLLVSYQ